MVFWIAKADDTGQGSGGRSQLELKLKPAVVSGSWIFIFFAFTKIKIEICFTCMNSFLSLKVMIFFPPWGNEA